MTWEVLMKVEKNLPNKKNRQEKKITKLLARAKMYQNLSRTPRSGNKKGPSLLRYF